MHGTSVEEAPATYLHQHGSMLQVPWEPLLTREELLRGLSYYGTGVRLQAVAAKLLARQPIKVGRLGR